MTATHIPKVETHIIYFGSKVVVYCDGRCDLAWGMNWKGPKKRKAPVHPGTVEGSDIKPQPPYPPKEHNKWCVRECERSYMEDEE